jgi:fucose permease
MGVSASLFFQGFFVTGVRKMGQDARVPSVIIASGLVGAIVMPLICAQLIGQMGSRGFFWLILGWSAVVLAAAVPMMRCLNRQPSR